MTTIDLAPTALLAEGTPIILKRGGLRGIVLGIWEEPDLWGGPSVHSVKLTHRWNMLVRAWDRLPSPQFRKVASTEAERIG